MELTEVRAVYTGGNMWLFTAKLNNNYLFADDCKCVLMVNANPYENFDDVCYEDWQNSHKVRDLSETEQKSYFNQIIEHLLQTPTTDDLRGGITDTELKRFQEF